MKSSTETGLRLALAGALIAVTALYLHGRGTDAPAPPHKDVTEFPRAVGDWQGGDPLPFTQETLDVLGPGRFLERIYQRPSQPFVDLLLEYFPSQRTHDTIHSPKHCLPGAGWEPVESSVLHLTGPDGRPVPANYYVIANGENREVVLYWYEAHGRVVASDYRAKFYLVWDAMRLNRTDGSMVRVVTPVTGGEDVARAKERAVGFAERVLPMLNAYIPG
ncbi:MAG TPA: EpsI family protein [Terriglobia bacterium]|nr:EpsI family protein [Terriglobia bacterium]